MTRRMLLLSGEQYRWMDRGLNEKKLEQYERVLKRAKKERLAADGHHSGQRKGSTS
jgi:hypothetical protein